MIEQAVQSGIPFLLLHQLPSLAEAFLFAWGRLSPEMFQIIPALLGTLDIPFGKRQAAFAACKCSFGVFRVLLDVVYWLVTVYAVHAFHG